MSALGAGAAVDLGVVPPVVDLGEHELALLPAGPAGVVALPEVQQLLRHRRHLARPAPLNSGTAASEEQTKNETLKQQSQRREGVTLQEC